MGSVQRDEDKADVTIIVLSIDTLFFLFRCDEEEWRKETKPWRMSSILGKNIWNPILESEKTLIRNTILRPVIIFFCSLKTVKDEGRWNRLANSIHIM